MDSVTVTGLDRPNLLRSQEGLEGSIRILTVLDPERLVPSQAAHDCFELFSSDGNHLPARSNGLHTHPRQPACIKQI
jgi:hypothetical protein